MAIKTHDSTNGNGLFDILGVAFNAIAVLNTSCGTTVATASLAILSQFAKVTPNTQNADDVQGLGDAIATWQATGAGLASQIQTACGNILTSFVQADTATVAPANLAANLQYLINQMQANGTTGGSYVAANTPSVTSGTPIGSGNAGDAVVLLTTVQPNGMAGQNALAESIVFTVTSTQSTLSPAIVANSPPVDANRLDFAWPMGSGLSGHAITLTNPANSLLTNGQFQTDTILNLPDDWIPAVATPSTTPGVPSGGSTVVITVPCVQTITINSSYTGGSFILTWSDGANTHATIPLPYNVTGGAMQTALQAIAQLANVTVSQAGNVYTITFTGVGGAVATLGGISFLTGGSGTAITPAVVTAANAYSYSGQSLQFVGGAGELTTLYQALPTLSPNTIYFLHFRLLANSVTAGALTVSVVQGIAGSIVQDSQANANNTPSVAVTLSGLTTDTWTSQHFCLMLSPAMPQPVYLKVALTTAINSGGSIYLDDFTLTAGQQLYNGGPSVAAVSGQTPSAVTDSWTYVIANTWSTPTTGGWQTWFNRVFGMADLGLLLPTSVAGGTEILDGLIT